MKNWKVASRVLQSVAQEINNIITKCKKLSSRMFSACLQANNASKGTVSIFNFRLPQYSAIIKQREKEIDLE